MNKLNVMLRKGENYVEQNYRHEIWVLASFHFTLSKMKTNRCISHFRQFYLPIYWILGFTTNFIWIHFFCENSTMFRDNQWFIMWLQQVMLRNVWTPVNENRRGIRTSKTTATQILIIAFISQCPLQSWLAYIRIARTIHNSSFSRRRRSWETVPDREKMKLKRKTAKRVIRSILELKSSAFTSIE